MELVELKDAIDGWQESATAALEKTTKDVKALRDRDDALKRELDNLEMRHGRLAALGGIVGRPAGEFDRKAWSNFLRQGIERMDPFEAKALMLSPDPSGGYLAPEEFIRELLKNVVLFSPIRALARVMTINSSGALLPKRTGTLTCSWVGETQQRSETQPSYGQNRYDVKEMAAYVDCSNAMLEDSSFDIGAELVMDFAEQFGAVEGKAFLQGTGPLQPDGIMTTLANIAYTASGDATKVTADGLIRIFHDLPPPYRSNATWIMNSSTLATVRQLKTADTSAQFLFWPGQQLGGTPGGSILGRPIVEAPDLDDIGAGKFPILFGDFQQGFRIFDRVVWAVLRDPYSQASVGTTRFHGRRRLAAGIGKAEAIRRLKVATS